MPHCSQVHSLPDLVLVIACERWQKDLIVFLEIPSLDAIIESDKPLFFIINTYTTGYSQSTIKNTLQRHLEEKGLNGKIEADELGIEIKGSSYYLPCGFTTRWSND